MSLEMWAKGVFKTSRGDSSGNSEDQNADRNTDGKDYIQSFRWEQRSETIKLGAYLML